MLNQTANPAIPGRRRLDYHRHLQHGWRRSPFLLTAALRNKRNYSRILVSSPTSPDDEFPQTETE